ncbi:DUF1178 family protein [Qingshengfaniella alkalisoli]|uniref:DUF1178 family protein n=1 Tax=Qingshengfaniella alkalisoli TaxID=2599296 RepID=A0A5B8IV65_9RHOB|nr:DUF1178 family protein [Qingshengfaniella alkalisoli]QDY69504.1 DUF1178 family protein [Qingshengfaniella alkalisoli]
MIRYSLKCAEGHEFESWFQSASAFDTLQKSAMVECPDCGSNDVSKSIMAPRVTPGRNKVDVPAKPQKSSEPTPEQVKAAISKLKTEVEANSDYVGDRFVKEARQMHSGEAPARAIHGEAKPAEARKLLEDGVPVMPLPFIPTRKTN